MAADPSGVLTGQHYLDGNHAACEGALAAGCRFASGYPITPSTEVVERIAARLPRMGGMFIQMEDEIAASITLQGAVWAGKKALTVTSGPGFSLMMEHIGEEFDGVISSVVSFGLFIELPSTIEGLVHITNLPDDYYEYDEVAKTLTGTRTGRRYRLGQAVRVRLVAADYVSRRIDFELI